MIHFDLATKKSELTELESAIQAPDFWQSQTKSAQILQRQKLLKTVIDNYQALNDDLEELEIMAELALAEKDDSMEKEFQQGIKKIDAKLDKMKLEARFNGEYDNLNAILSIHAGSGGLDAMDWADMLYRMYLRWGEQHGYKMTILDYTPDDNTGIKGVSILYKGDNAYGYLKSEKGVHRLIRMSPFDSSGKRHTSFAAVDVLPEIIDDEAIVINNEDIKIDTYRASGAGGQHVNTTDSAVRITHLPTGIIVQCQNERSQISNRDTAMKMLKAKLIDLKEREHKEKIEDIQGDYSEISWGSQIRSYVFQPYQMVKDHRTNVENGNVDNVMNGALDEFMIAYLNQNNN